MVASLNHILLAPWRQLDRDARFILSLLGGMVVLGLGVALGLASYPTTRFMIGALAAGLVMSVAWFMLVSSLLQQNHPNAARLVPGHLRRLRQAALLAWLLLSGAPAVLLWLALPGNVSLPASILGIAALGVCLAWLQVHPALWLVASLAPLTGSLSRPDLHLAPLWSAIAGAWQAQTWLAFALGLLACGNLLARLFNNGSGGHRAGYARRDMLRRLAQQGPGAGGAGRATFGRAGEWLGQPFDRLASAWLLRLIAHARPEPASVMSRAGYVLHGQQHWLRHLLGAAMVFSLMGLGVGIAFAPVIGETDIFWTSSALGLSIGLAGMGLNPAFALPNALWHSRREQALLVLLPGMPRGAALNRAVAGLQLRHFLVAGLLTTSAVLALAQLSGQAKVLCLPIAALPFGMFWLTRSPATLRAPTSWTAAVPAVGFMLLAGVLALLHTVVGMPLWLLTGASLAVSVPLLAVRWNALGTAPPALPAGRLG